MRRRLGPVVMPVSLLAAALVAGVAPTGPVRGSAWGSARPGPGAAGLVAALEFDSSYAHVGDLACAPSEVVPSCTQPVRWRPWRG